MLNSSYFGSRKDCRKKSNCYCFLKAARLQIGQAGGCAPLVSMLTSATALHSSVISFQMAVDHDEAQAHAATALAHLAALSSNQVGHIQA